MTCCVPFNNKNLDISFFVFKPTVVMVEDLVDALKHLSLQTHTLGCVQSSIFRSIHGNMIIWYGAWEKQLWREKREELRESVVSMVKGMISGKGVLVEESFMDAYGGESRDNGFEAARLSSGDIISINYAATTNVDLNDVCYAVLALFRSRFSKMEGITSGLCFKSQTQSMPSVLCLHVWDSLLSCYSWILNSHHTNWMLPYLERFSIHFKYDILRVEYVTTSDHHSSHYYS